LVIMGLGLIFQKNKNNKDNNAWRTKILQPV
jgi:hypothetical protein